MTIDVDVDQINELQKEIAVASQAQDAISEWHTDLKKQMGGNKEELVRHIEKLCTEYMKTARATLSQSDKFDNAKRTAFDTTQPSWYGDGGGIALEVPDEMVEASKLPMDLLLGLEIEWEGIRASLIKASLIKIGEAERAQYILFLSGKTWDAEIQWVREQTDLQWHTDEPYYEETDNSTLREALEDRMDFKGAVLRKLEEQVRSKLGDILKPHLIGDETVEQAVKRALDRVAALKQSKTLIAGANEAGRVTLTATVWPVDDTTHWTGYCGIAIPKNVAGIYQPVHWCAGHGIIVSSVG